MLPMMLFEVHNTRTVDRHNRHILVFFLLALVGQGTPEAHRNDEGRRGVIAMGRSDLALGQLPPSRGVGLAEIESLDRVAASESKVGKAKRPQLELTG